MSGKPDRAKPKKAIQIHLSFDIYASSQILLNQRPNLFRSYSQFVETLVFCMFSLYETSNDDELIKDLRHLKAKRYVQTNEDDICQQLKLLHVTIDVDALAFLSYLLEKYKRSFSSRSDLVESFFLYALAFCDSNERIAYIMQRLKQAKLNNPIRKRSSKTISETL